jgi:tRNA threonylcarbamoyladenosine biosynthesis protein TsaE
MNRTSTIRTTSEEETIAVGRELASRLNGVVLLEGDLGAGKTTLVRGIVSGIEGASAGEVSSPTFTLIHDYGEGVFHIDLYRLDDERDIESLGLDDLFAQARLALVEWGQKLGRFTPDGFTEIRIEAVGETERLFHVSQRGAHASCN